MDAEVHAITIDRHTPSLTTCRSQVIFIVLGSLLSRKSPNTSQCLVALNYLGTLTSIFNVTEVISECKQNLSTFTRQFAISESVIFLRIDFSFTFHVYLIFFLTEALLKLLLVPIIQYILFKEYPIYSYITISVSRYIFVQHFFPGF